MNFDICKRCFANHHKNIYYISLKKNIVLIENENLFFEENHFSCLKKVKTPKKYAVFQAFFEEQNIKKALKDINLLMQSDCPYYAEHQINDWN